MLSIRLRPRLRVEYRGVATVQVVDKVDKHLELHSLGRNRTTKRVLPIIPLASKLNNKNTTQYS